MSNFQSKRRRREEEQRRIQHLRQELEEERQDLAQIMYNIDQQKKALEAFRSGRLNPKRKKSERYWNRF
jgi:hypothetical protein